MQSISVSKSVNVRTVPVQRKARVQAGKSEEIYIGFEKNDFDRAGRKGRVIKDDPKKYPGKEDAGFFIGVAGGWAGGEAGLWELREQVEADLDKKKGTQTSKVSSSAPKKLDPSAKDVVYLGFGKDELDVKKTGVQGRMVIDDARKYPGREDIGFIVGATGGFAGGEAAIKSESFVNNGELRLNLDGRIPARKQSSPVTVGLVLMMAGVALTAALVAGQDLLEYATHK